MSAAAVISSFPYFFVNMRTTSRLGPSDRQIGSHSGLEVGIWEIISKVSPLPTDRQSIGRLRVSQTALVGFTRLGESSLFSATLCCVLNNRSDFRWPPKYLRSRERHENRGWKSWVQNISLAKAVVLVRIDPQPEAMKISLIGVRLFFRGQLDEICQHSVSELRTL